MKMIFVLTVLMAGAVSVFGQEVASGYKNTIVVTSLLKESTTASGQPIVYPTTGDPQVTAVLVEIPPGTETGWHKHPYPCYAYMLSGELTVAMEGGKSHKVSAGSALIEAVDVLHNGRNTGTEPAKLVMFVTGEKDKPFTVKEPAP